MIIPEVYTNEIMNRYGVNLDCSTFKNSRKKWSDRVMTTFRSSGKQWNDQIEEEVKTLVADCICAYTSQSIKTKSEGSVNSLIDMIKKRCAS